MANQPFSDSPDPDEEPQPDASRSSSADLDDIEEEYPAIELDDEIQELDPEKAVRAWNFVSVGHRPKDYMARDFLLGSLWRDCRPRLFHQWSQEPPAELVNQVEHLAGEDQRQALQLAVLHLLHRRHVATHLPLTFADAEQGVRDEYGKLLRLWRCWPFGAEMGWDGEVERSERDVCQLGWLCPWCQARLVVALYDQIRRGPLKKPKGKHLVLAW